MLAEFKEHMIGQRSGDASVIDVRITDGWDYVYTEEYLRVELVLADPPSGMEFWPHSDVHELQRRGRAELERLRVAPSWFVAFAYRADFDEESTE